MRYRYNIFVTYSPGGTEQFLIKNAIHQKMSLMLFCRLWLQCTFVVKGTLMYMFSYLPKQGGN